MKVDMSAKAVSQRLRQVSELRELCLSLAKAGETLKVAKPGTKRSRKPASQKLK
jgi:hypothetical protein